MMFSFSFALVILITLRVNGATNDINALNPTNSEKSYQFGKLRLSSEGEKEELIPSSESGKSPLNQEQPSNVEPLLSPCLGSRSLTKLAHPTDKTKFIQCRDEFHYEVFTCLNGGEFNDQTKACDTVTPSINKCEQEKPCLNDGTCVLLTNSTFKCNCRKDWTGDRCETPLNSCVAKPCGPNAECRQLKTTDYEQDYICLCNERTSYGLNCQETTPNLCLTGAEQFYPFAFSQHVYVQCDSDLIYFQPCAALLYWNQDGKLCDRKRPPKADLSKFIIKNKDNEKMETNMIEEIIMTTTIQPEQQNQKGNREYFGFVPARVADRQQLLSNMNNQQGINSRREQQIQELPSQSMESNQIRQDFNTKVKQWPQNTQQQWSSTSMDTSSMDSNMGQPQIRQDNHQQEQNFPQQNQAFGTQQWLNQVPDTNTQGYQHFVPQPQSWQSSQTIQSQPRFQDQNQQTLFETTTPAPIVVRLQVYGNQNQEQSWQNKVNTQIPQATSLKVQNTQNFVPQSQTWQGQQSTASIPEETSSYNKNRLNTGIQQNNQFGLVQQNTQNQQSWQNTGNNQIRQPERLSTETQRFRSDNQQWTPTISSESSVDLNNLQLQKGVQSQIRQDNHQQEQSSPQQNQVFGTKQWLNQVPDTNTQGSLHYVGQPQWWQGSQTIQNQPRFQDQNQQAFLETTTAAQNVVNLQGYGNQNQEQSWQNKQNTQQIQNQPAAYKSNQIFAFQPKQWTTDTSKNNKQDNSLTSQSWSQNQNQQAFIPEASSQIRNNQFILNKQQQDLPIQNSFEQKPSWQNKEQLQTQQGKMTDSADFKMQTSQTFAARPALQSFQTQPWSQNGQLTATSFETTTVPNKAVQQGLTMQNLQGWQPNRLVEQRQQDTNQIDYQTTDQRKTLGSIPTLLSGSWKPRSY